jgi:hypothetical protein
MPCSLEFSDDVLNAGGGEPTAPDPSFGLAGRALRGVQGGERAGRDAAERAAVPPDLHTVLRREGQLPPGDRASGQPQHRRHPPQRLLARPDHGQPHLDRFVRTYASSFLALAGELVLI